MDTSHTPNPTVLQQASSFCCQMVLHCCLFVAYLLWNNIRSHNHVWFNRGFACRVDWWSSEPSMALTPPSRTPIHNKGSCALHTNNKEASRSNSSGSPSSMIHTPVTHPSSSPKPPLLQVSSTCTQPIMLISVRSVGCMNVGLRPAVSRVDPF